MLNNKNYNLLLIIIKIDTPRSNIPISSVLFIFSLNINSDTKIENISSICPTALTSAAVARPNATNHPNVAPVPQIPAGKLGFQYLKTEKNCSFLKKNKYKPTNIVWNTIAKKEIYKDLSNNGASTEIIAILKVTTEAAKSNPDKSPIKVPIDIIELNKYLNVPNTVSAFFAKDKNKTEITPSKIPKISGNENTTFNIITSKKAINITSVFEKPIPVAKLLWENTCIKT